MSTDNEADTERLNRAVDSWSSSVGERLLRPLAAIYRDGPRHPELIGTGVLLRVADLIVLITAAHVADAVIHGPHYFGAAGALIPLGGLKMTSPLPPGTSRDGDRTDIAYWVLEPQTAARLSSADTLTPRDFELEPPSPEVDQRQYFVNGYPGSRQPRSMTNGEYEARPFSFLTEEESLASYESIHIDRERNLFVGFHKNNTFRRGEKTTGPDLFGVSGGAIWSLGGAHASLQAPLLAGIVGSWRRSSPTGIVATRARVIATAIASHFPHTVRGHT